MDDAERKAVRAVFRRHGVEAVKRAAPIDPTEEVFLVSHDDAGDIDLDAPPMQVPADCDRVAREVMAVLPGRKIWVIPDGPRWNGQPL